ncbi:MAG: helix-turn-helix domain-containing protein [Pyrinomonadaceae bacterium]
MVKQRLGFCLIDPSGFLYRDLIQWLAYVRPSRRIIPFDPSYPQKTVGFSPFKITSNRDEAIISTKVDRMVSLTLRALGTNDISSAPRMERVMRCVYYVILERNLPLEAIRYFLNPRYFHIRDSIIASIESEAIREEWFLLTNRRPEAYRNIVDSTANRLFKFLTQQTVKRILGIPENSINIKQITDNRDALLVNLQSSDLFSADASRIIGTFLVNEIWETMRRRTRDEVRKAPPFYLIVDEFQSFATPDFGAMLDQSAKYGLHLILFHQNLNQLDSEIRTAMTACHTRFVFGGITGTDASQMLEGSYPYQDSLRDDISVTPSLPSRYYFLRRPSKRLAYAYTPDVPEYRVTEDRIDRYLNGITEGFLSPAEIDTSMRLAVANLEESAHEKSVVAVVPDSVDLGQILTSDENRKEKPKAPPTAKPKREFVLTYDRARGTYLHSQSQKVIASIGRLYGFESKIEKALPDGSGFIDIVLERGDVTIACEVSITTSAEWEAKNLLKCLRAGYQQVWVIVNHIKKIAGVTSRIREVVPVVDQTRIKVLTTDTCFAELSKLGVRVDPKTGKPAKLASNWLSIRDVAEYFGMSESTARRWQHEGRIPYTRVGRKILFDPDVIRVIGKQNLTGKHRVSVNLDRPVRIEKSKPKGKKQQDDRYRKMLNLD